jgi:hypothetical protein
VKVPRRELRAMILSLAVTMIFRWKMNAMFERAKL